jgi:GTP-binding protein
MDGPAVKILSAEFDTTAVAAEGYPRAMVPELAFAGRSNVGKSSMINALCQRRKLVRVSNTPGRTRTLNFFDVALEVREPSGGGTAARRLPLRFCDLPGYGFARASKAERKAWDRMIGGYLSGREGLRGVVCIVDASVGPTEDDFDVIGWIAGLGRRVIVAATKIDQVPKHRRIPRTKEIASALHQPGAVVGVSATEPINLGALWERILEAIA